MPAYTLDPLLDPRWPEFLERHARASVFHSRGWLEALRRTYGYEPIVYTTSPPTADLANGLVFCRIDSWLTGRRLVSLPFSDHTEPLVDSEGELQYLLGCLERDRKPWGQGCLRHMRLPRDDAVRGAVSMGLAILYRHPQEDRLYRPI